MAGFVERDTNDTAKACIPAWAMIVNPLLMNHVMVASFDGAGSVRAIFGRNNRKNQRGNGFGAIFGDQNLQAGDTHTLLTHEVLTFCQAITKGRTRSHQFFFDWFKSNLGS